MTRESKRVFEAKLNQEGWDNAVLVKAFSFERAVRTASVELGYSRTAVDRGYTVAREGECQWGITMHDGDVIHLAELNDPE